MKKTYFLPLIIFLAIIFSSCGKITRNATIIRDCTGTYLRLNNRDYLVCNPSMVSSVPDEGSVEVKYNKKSSCPPSDPNQMMCELYHKSYGFVEITEVK